MPTNYFDVVVIGMKLEGLLVASLLAKRGFRILVVGHGDSPPWYELNGMSLPRSPNPIIAMSSPVVQRVLRELALFQSFRRRMEFPDPSMQVVLPERRFDFSKNDTDLEREIDREFPEVKRPVEEFHKACQCVQRILDGMLSKDLVWPPESFFEKREFSKASSDLDLNQADCLSKEPFGEFSERHPFRMMVDAPVRFLTDLDPDQIGPYTRYRAYGHWLHGPGHLRGGTRWLYGELLQKIGSCTGEVRSQDRVDRILLRRGAVHAVQLKGVEGEIGCGFVIANCQLASLLSLVPNRGSFEEQLERLGEPQTAYDRYTVNVVLDADGIPEGMGRRVYMIRDTSKPRVEDNLLHIERSELASGTHLLCIETLMNRRGMEGVAEYRDQARERVLTSLRQLIPFLDNHLRWVDSPHDARDAQDTRNNRSVASEQPWTRGPHTMEGISSFPLLGPLGACALPVRTPIRRLMFCNAQVVPGFGTEGRFLAAWTAARIVTKADSKKDWMRRGLWTRVEL
ncbi:MAG: hypothetical protein AAF550_03660 [Myxococcota bacterium]